MWWGLLASIIAFGTVVMLFRGPVAALGAGVLISFVFPSWIVQPFAGVPIDLRISSSIVLLLVNLAHPQRRISWTFVTTDWAIFAMYFVHVASDSWQDGFALSHFARAFGEWSVPYIAGRLAIQTVQDWRWLTGIAVIVAMVLAAWATTEAITRVNIGNPVFGARPVDRTNPMGIRLGLKRAEGPTRHPIWLGMLQVLLLPWTIVAAYHGLRGEAPTWWISTPFLSFIGILATASRGPAISALAIVFLTAVFCLPKIRMHLVIAGIACASLGFFANKYILNSLENFEGTKWNSTQKRRSVEFDGEQHRFTSMSHRWLVFTAYRSAISEVGCFGFGTARTSTFPMNVPLGPEAKQTLAKFWTIDCEYLLILLRFGWAGLFSFLSICVFSSIRIASQAAFVAREERVLPYAIAATLISVSATLLVEWMPHDYGFMFLWLCGVASGPRLRHLERVPKIPRNQRKLQTVVDPIRFDVDSPDETSSNS